MIGGFAGLSEQLFRRAQAVFGQLVSAWLQQDVDVVAHGPFFQHDEQEALLHPALQRVAGDPDRKPSRHPDLLRRTYDRVEQLLPTMPTSEWVFDTDATGW